MPGTLQSKKGVMNEQDSATSTATYTKLTGVIYLAISIRVNFAQDTAQHVICVFQGCDRVSRDRSA